MEKVKAFGANAEDIRNRFKLSPTSGMTDSTVDYYKLAEQEFGFSIKKAKIAVIGVGGAGQNCVTRLSEMGCEGAVTIAANTDAKHLAVGKADKKILLGKELTKGLGCGGYPEVGKKAAEESRNEIKEALEGADIVFAIAGLGKGTGTGGIPVVCEIAKSLGALVIAVVEMPFKMEGARVSKAEDGLMNLRQVCDTAIVIENDRLLKYAGTLSVQQAFAVADELIASMVKGITETITLPSLVNLDYADVRTVMGSGGVACIGVGESSSSDRARDAVTRALQNPLLEVDYTGATGALVHITGGPDLRLEEVNLIGETVCQTLDPSATVYWGARILPEFENKVQVISIITGVKSPYILGPITYEKPVVKEISQSLGIEVLR
jgi:cell division protein FtsZ